MKFTYLVVLFMFTLIIGTLGFSVNEGLAVGQKPRQKKRQKGANNMFIRGGVQRLNSA